MSLPQGIPKCSAYQRGNDHGATLHTDSTNGEPHSILMMDEAVAWDFPINKALILNIVVSLQKGAPTKSQNALPINAKRPRMTLVARR